MLSYRSTIVLLTAILAGCNTAAGPVDTLEGDYVIEMVNGRPLPSVLFEDVGGWRVSILEGGLSIRGGEFAARTVQERIFQGDTVTIDSTGQGFVKRQSTGVLLVADDDPGTVAVSVANDGRLVATYDLISATVTFRPIEAISGSGER